MRRAFRVSRTWKGSHCQVRIMPWRVARKASLERCRELEWQLQRIEARFRAAMPKKVRRAVRPSARDLQRVACGAPEVRGDFGSGRPVVMDAELQTAGRYMTRSRRWSTARTTR